MATPKGPKRGATRLGAIPRGIGEGTSAENGAIRYEPGAQGGEGSPSEPGTTRGEAGAQGIGASRPDSLRTGPDSPSRPSDSLRAGPGAPLPPPPPGGSNYSRPSTVVERPAGTTGGPLPYRTIEDVNRILDEVRSGRLDVRDFSPGQRRGVLAAIVDGKRTRKDLAAFFKVSIKRIDDDLRRIRARSGAIVAAWDVPTVLGFLQDAAERAGHLALERKDGLGYWSIQRDLVRSMKELGLFGVKGDRESVRMTLEVLGARYGDATAKLAIAMNDPSACGEDPRNARIVQGAGRTLPLPTEVIAPPAAPEELRAAGVELEPDEDD